MILWQFLHVIHWIFRRTTPYSHRKTTPGIPVKAKYYHGFVAKPILSLPAAFYSSPLCLNRDASFSYVCELVLSRRILAWNRLKKRAENGFWIVVEHLSLEENTVSNIAANGLWGGQKMTYSNLEQLNLGCFGWTIYPPLGRRRSSWWAHRPTILYQKVDSACRICPACNTNQTANLYLALISIMNIYPSRYLLRQTWLKALKEIQPTQRANSVRTIYGRGKTQKTTLETLYSLYPTDNMPRVFDSCHSIKTQGEKVASLKLASERDLLILQYTMILWRRR